MDLDLEHLDPALKPQFELWRGLDFVLNESRKSRPFHTMGRVDQVAEEVDASSHLASIFIDRKIEIMRKGSIKPHDFIIVTCGVSK